MAPSLYARTARTVRDRPGLGAAVLAGAAMHATGHAFLAAAAGALTRAFAGAGPMDGGSIPLGGAPTSAALVLAVSGVGAALIKLIGGALASWAEARVAGDVAGAVRLGVLDDVLCLAPASPGQADQGRRLAALTTHIQDVERGVSHGVLAELRAIVQLLPLLALLVALAPRLASTAVVALLAFGVLAFALRRTFKRAHARAVASSSILVGAADEAVRHAELWATYGAEEKIRAHVASLGDTIASEAARLRLRASLLSSTSEVLGALALVLALVLVARGALDARPATVIPFAIVFFMAYRPLRELVDARLLRARGEAALAAALPGATPLREAKQEAPREWPLAPLVLQGVQTRHGAHAPLSLEVPPGRIVAIVGPTGIGKTSLLRTLLGLEHEVEGTLRYGDHDLGRAGLGPGERPFAWVPQDVPVVRGTLAVNVGLGARAGELDPAPILEDLGAGALARSLGDDVVVNGRLSGGERQWVAVARALATGLPVLLLDEPTSSLDPAAQSALLDALSRLRGRRTVILVTHRPEPLAIADVVIRLSGRAPQAAAAAVPVRDSQIRNRSSGGPAVTSTAPARKSSPSRT